MAKPVVDGLEKKLDGKMKVVHLDVQGEDGAVVADRYDVHATPAFVVLDRHGKVIYRQIGGRPDAATIEQKIANLPP